MNKPELSLEDRVALVTGASGGIGQAIVELFGKAGATLFLNGVKEEKLKKLSDHLEQEGIPNKFKALDITTPGAAEVLVRTVIDKMGHIDVLVNCAGINRPQKAEEVSENNWDDVMAINLKALFLVSQAVGREMIKQRKGKIINISSQAGSVAFALQSQTSIVFAPGYGFLFTAIVTLTAGTLFLDRIQTCCSWSFVFVDLLLELYSIHLASRGKRGQSTIPAHR